MGIVLVANFLLAFIYYKTLWVRQANIDATLLDSLQIGQSGRVCMEGQQGAFRKLDFPPCTADCLCFSLQKSGEEDMRRQAEFFVESVSKVRVILKSTTRVPRDFQKTVAGLAQLLGHADTKA
jgi:hypothetical protein